MNVVIRPVNDQFLREVAFPAFERGTADATPALETLRAAVADERMQLLLDSLLEGGVTGGFFTLETERWLEAVYRLLFSEWAQDGDRGWKVVREPAGFAASFDESLQLGLLLEEPKYPYATPKEAEQMRDDFLAVLPRRAPLTGLICGVWDPLPAFAPDQILNTQGRGIYRPAEGLAVAEWAYRTADEVERARALLPDQLKNLLERERARLAPLPLLDGKAWLAHWLEGAPMPALGVAFSGLGAQASQWGRDIGSLVALIRTAHQEGLGLSCVMTGVGRSMADAMDSY